MSHTFRLFSCAAGLSLACLTASPAWSQAGDVQKGLDLAKAHCADCHELTGDKGREREGRYVPSFPEIANTPHYSLVRLRRIIAVPPHSDMPKAKITTDEINDLAHYITSLKKQ